MTDPAEKWLEAGARGLCCTGGECKYVTSCRAYHYKIADRTIIRAFLTEAEKDGYALVNVPAQPKISDTPTEVMPGHWRIWWDGFNACRATILASKVEIAP